MGIMRFFPPVDFMGFNEDLRRLDELLFFALFHSRLPRFCHVFVVLPRWKGFLASQRHLISSNPITPPAPGCRRPRNSFQAQTSRGIYSS
jgi:hypothetical protein